MKSTHSYFLKRSLGVLFSFCVLLFLVPVFLIIGIMIKIKSPKGPVIFGHLRVEQNGKLFKVYKFRSMIPNAQEALDHLLATDPEAKAEYEKDFKLKNDPRIIPGIGHFMRKTSLDELPQFFNVLIGNMSVVGPRPIVPDEVKMYGEDIKYYYAVKPGITGLWQVNGRNDIDYKERVELDKEYVENQSLWLDVKIILKTVKVIFCNKGAY